MAQQRDYLRVRARASRYETTKRSCVRLHSGRVKREELLNISPEETITRICFSAVEKEAEVECLQTTERNGTKERTNEAR